LLTMMVVGAHGQAASRRGRRPTAPPAGAPRPRAAARPRRWPAPRVRPPSPRASSPRPSSRRELSPPRAAPTTTSGSTARSLSPRTWRTPRRAPHPFLRETSAALACFLRAFRASLHLREEGVALDVLMRRPARAPAKTLPLLPLALLLVFLLPLLLPPQVTADRAFNGFGTNFENSAEPIYGTQARAHGPFAAWPPACCADAPRLLLRPARRPGLRAALAPAPSAAWVFG
jgi:hypothetical protein